MKQNHSKTLAKMMAQHKSSNELIALGRLLSLVEDDTNFYDLDSFRDYHKMFRQQDMTDIAEVDMAIWFLMTSEVSKATSSPLKRAFDFIKHRYSWSPERLEEEWLWAK